MIGSYLEARMNFMNRRTHRARSGRMYTLIVGTQDWSSWSLRPYLALMAVGAPFETEVIQLRAVPASHETPS